MKICLNALCLLLLFSCGSKINKIKIAEPPKELITNIYPTIEGDVGKYCNAKPEKIKITFTKDSSDFMTGIHYEIPIKIQFSKTGDIKAGSGYNHYGPRLDLEFLDKNDKLIQGISSSMNNSMDEISTLIKTSNKEEWVIFKGMYIANAVLPGTNIFEESKKFIEDISKVNAIRIKSEIIEEKQDPNPNETVQEAADRISGKNSKSSSSGGSGNCSEFLNKYEEIVNDYIPLAQKLKNDPQNTSIITDMSSIAQKLMDLEKNYANCKNDKDIAEKIAKLAIKMANTRR